MANDSTSTTTMKKQLGEHKKYSRVKITIFSRLLDDDPTFDQSSITDYNNQLMILFF